MNTEKKNKKIDRTQKKTLNAYVKSETKYFSSDINNKKCRRIFADIFYFSHRDEKLKLGIVKIRRSRNEKI